MPQANDISTGDALRAEIDWYNQYIQESIDAGQFEDAEEAQAELDELLQANQ